MAHESGDSRLAAELLGPVVDDPARWALVPGTAFTPEDVAYAAGISRLFGGDVDGAAVALRRGLEGAATALRLGLEGRRTDDRIRRALAQVELARGELVAAEQLLDPSAKADLMDQALVVTLRWRQGRHAEAHQLASDLVNAKPRRQQRGQHPWTVAGVLVQAAQVLAELGDTGTLVHGLERAFGLIRDAPAELPVRPQLAILLAAARRQEGRLDEADEVLATSAPFLDPNTCDMGLYELERARVCRARGDAAGASTRYAQAVATLDAAGERWHAAQVRAEASPSPGPSS